MRDDFAKQLTERERIKVHDAVRWSIDQETGGVSAGSGSKVYMTLKYMREKFDMLTNQNILKITKARDEQFSYYIEKPYDSMEKTNAKRSGILQDLFFLSRTLKEDINLKNIESLMFV